MRQLTPLTLPEKEFVVQNAQTGVAQLLLQKHRYPQLDVPKLVQYVEARQKIQYKLPTWYQNLNVIYPPNLSLEQSSSEITAGFKANLVAGNLLIDLTGGFGIDSFFLAQKVKEVIYLDRNPDLALVAAHNAQLLGAGNLTFYTGEAATFLETFAGTADWIYLDPARRNNQNQKVYRLQDCEPDIVGLLPLLNAKGKNILLKTSPMLDINQAVQALQQVCKIWVVAVENEVKEVLYHLTSPTPRPLTIATHNLVPARANQYFEFVYAEEENTSISYSLPLTYIYEPNAALMKAGGFKSVAKAYRLHKLHRNSHLYTAEALQPAFPGRVFRLISSSRYQKKELLAQIPEKKANITVRNFPETVAQIRAKTGLKEGGHLYLFATTDLNQKPVILICEKVARGK